MKQVYVNTPLKTGLTITLDDKQAHHIFSVLRTKPNELIRVVNAQSQVYLAVSQTNRSLYLVEEMVSEQINYHITLCTALYKMDHFEWMLQKATELGVTRIVPFVSERTIIHLDDQKKDKKLARWSEILLAASRQSNRHDLVDLCPITHISALTPYQSQVNLVAYEKADASQHLSSYLQDPFKSITIVLGPEGGFSEKEIANLKNAHFSPCSLGSRILRAETAACYVLSAINYQQQLFEESL